MASRKGEDREKPGVKPVAAKVDKALWDEVKIQAIREGRKIGEILHDALRSYLEAKSQD
jgi:hypothetical protein